jgi:phosphoglycerate dehydrogenase-like enzyme
VTRPSPGPPVTTGPSLAVGPGPEPDLEDALRASGAQVVDLASADGLVWTDSDPSSFPDSLPERITWVQLPAAGVERWLSAGVIDHEREWTSAAGAYAESVAEHAVAMLLAGVRGLVRQSRSQTWDRPVAGEWVGTVSGARVAVVGAGGVGAAVIARLASLGASCVAVTRRGQPVPGAETTLPASDVATAWTVCDHAVLAMPSTPQTRGVVDRRALRELGSRAWLVNVGRGDVVDTDALVDTLREGELGGACLDVTDPEPLPDGHPLWSLPTVLITPHVANPPHHLRAAYREFVAENVRRRTTGRPLLGPLNISAGY